MRGFGGVGVQNVRDAGFEHMHTLIAAPDYLAMPELFHSGKRFDFLLIDGYHSVDYTMVDFFYADLLLRTGGHVAFHDSGCAAVFAVCEFVLRNKPYRLVGPPIAMIYSDLARRLGRRLLNLVSGRAAEFREEIRHHQAWGYPTHVVDERRLRELERHVEPGRVALAAHAEIEGSADPVGATDVLLARAARAGAHVVYPAEVTGLDERNGRLRAVRTSAGDVEADVLIVACGTDTPRVAAMAGLRVPLKESPGVLVHTAPMPATLERVVLSPIAHMKQKPDGRIVTGSGFGGTPTTDASREAGERFLRTAGAVLPVLGEAALEKVTLGHRPLPEDEFPVIGFAPKRRDVYIAVMHSGVTLSPLVANLAATEILDGVEAEPLAPYRPARFASR